jgi:hypothetical protein
MMLYKALGFAVWKGGKWYMGRKLPARKVMIGGAMAAGAATLAAMGAARAAA